MTSSIPEHAEKLPAPAGRPAPLDAATHVETRGIELISEAERHGRAGVDPRAYVLEAARRAIATPGTVTLPSDLS